MNIERRHIDLSSIEDSEITTRSEVNPEDNMRYILGYASIKGTPSKQITERINGELITFTETISQTAFDNADISNIAHLVEHNHENIVGRTGVNTIVSNQPKGLFFKTEIPDSSKSTSIQEDLYRNSQQGIVKGASFAFRISPQGDKWERRDGQLHRTINSIERIVDVTSTYSPAYDSAFTFARSLNESEIEEIQETPAQVEEVKVQGFDLNTADIDFQMSLLKNIKY